MLTAIPITYASTLEYLVIIVGGQDSAFVSTEDEVRAIGRGWTATTNLAWSPQSRTIMHPIVALVGFVALEHRTAQ